MKKLILVLLLSSSAFAEQHCHYYPSKKNKIEFTGYKFTEKAGVTGTFKNFEILAPKKSKSIEDLFKGSTFTIDEMSLDAGKKARNVNISKGLLKNIEGTEIKGSVEKVDKSTKNMTVNINWGGKDHKVKMKYGHDRDKKIVYADGTIDLIEMGFSKAFTALGKICSPFHKGKDGKIKTWSDVTLRVEIGTTVKCN